MGPLTEETQVGQFVFFLLPDAVRREVADFLSGNKFGGTLDVLFVNNGLIIAHCIQMFYIL